MRTLWQSLRKWRKIYLSVSFYSPTLWFKEPYLSMVLVPTIGHIFCAIIYLTEILSTVMLKNSEIQK